MAARFLLALTVPVVGGCELSPAEFRTVNAFLTCIECTDGERESVLALSRKWYKHRALVDTLTVALLRGPSADRMATKERQINGYRHMLIDAGAPISWTDSSKYVARYSGYFRDSYRSRAAIALSRIGGQEAIKALDAARDSVNARWKDFEGVVAQVVFFDRDTIPGPAPQERNESGGGLSTTLTLISGDSQTVEGGMVLPHPIAFRVVSAAGQSIPGTPVHFAIDSGGGQLTDTLLITDAAGRVEVTGWRVGVYGTNTLRAVAGGPPVTVTAMADPPYAATEFVVTLAGGNAVPPAVTSATGSAELAVDGSFSYRVIAWDVSNVTIVSLHVGAPGANGPEVLALCGHGATGPCASGPGVIVASNSSETMGMTPPQLLAAMRRQETHVVVLTADNPTGLLRGQVLSVFP